MSKKLFLAPNRHLLSFAFKSSGKEVPESSVKAGNLQAEYDWQDIDDENDISSEGLQALLTGESAGTACVYVEQEDSESHQLLLPPVAAWIVNNQDKQSEVVEAAIKQWLDYIESAKQLLLLFPGQLIAIWPEELQSASVFEQQLQLILEQEPRIALATQEWESFVVRSEDEPSAISLASELLKQKQAQAESEKENFQAKAALKQDISDLSDELAKVCAERNKLAELEPQLSAKQAELEKSQQSNSDLQEKLNQSEAAWQQVNEALKAQEAQNNVLAQEVEKLKESLAQQEKVKAALEQAQDQLTALQEDYETASQDKLNLVSRLENNSKELQEKINQLEKANAQISQLQAENEKLTVSSQTADNELNQIKNKATELEAQLNAAGNELAEQKNELELASLQVNQLQQELEQLVQDKKALEEALKQSAAKEKMQAEQLNENSKALTEAQEEVQLAALQLNQLQEELESVSAKEQTLQTALQGAKAEAEQAKSEASESASKYSESFAELELATLQLGQLQEELEQVFAKEQTVSKALSAAETAQAAAKQNADAATAQLGVSQQEIELLTLQLSQIQEELEHYFVTYQKLKADSSTAAKDAERYWQDIIKARSGTFLVAQKVQITGGFDKDNVHRLNARLNNVTNLSTEWDAFSVMFNDRNGNLDIEFHAPAENRTYPLSEFVKTGNSKVCDYSIIKPFEGMNCTVLSALGDDDKSLLTEIVREVCIHLQNETYEVLKQAEQVDMKAWLPKLEQMLEALSSPDSMTTFLEELLTESEETIDAEKQAKALEQESTATVTEPAGEPTIPAPVGIPQVADDLSFTKLTLTQNMVAETNQHLSIRADNLSYADRSFEQFEFKIGAKRIEKDGFTQFGSIELREQQGVAPISDWSIAAEDKWGKKLVLSLGPIITAAEKQNITSLNSQDQAFVRAFLSALIKHIHKLDLSDIELANPLSDWHAMLISMLEQFNQTAPKTAEKGE